MEEKVELVMEEITGLEEDRSTILLIWKVLHYSLITESSLQTCQCPSMEGSSFLSTERRPES